MVTHMIIRNLLGFIDEVVVLFPAFLAITISVVLVEKLAHEKFLELGG